LVNLSANSKPARRFDLETIDSMNCLGSIFFDFNLPNATTWFYFSLLLAVALFFKFSRLLSVRNLDVLLLFLLVPGLLLLLEAYRPLELARSPLPRRSVQMVMGGAQAALGSGVGLSSLAPFAVASGPIYQPPAVKPSMGYVWLLSGSLVFLIRCFLDLGLVRRPALTPNLNLSGLAWLGAALFVCLVAVAIRKPASPSGQVGRRSAAVDETQRRAEGLVRQEIVGRNLASDQTEFWVEIVSAVVCHLAIVVGLGIVGWRHFQDAHAGVAAATFYLLLPYTAYHVDQVHHVLPSAFLLWAVAAYRLPTVSGLLLGLASGTGYFPALLLPAWMSFYWGRGAGRFVASFVLAAGLCLAVLGFFLWLEGVLTPSIQDALSLSDWQPWKEPAVGTRGLWTGIHWAYRLPVFIGYCAFVFMTAFWPVPKNLAHLLALSAAIVIGIQFWFADQGGVYVLWYLPFLLLLVFRPNLSDRLAPPIPSESDWLGRLGRRVRRLAGRFLRLPEPSMHVH
jgi:hypothetical protein